MAEYRTLSQHLEDLERTDPDVAQAADNYRRMTWRLTRGGPYFRRPKRRFTGKPINHYVKEGEG